MSNNWIEDRIPPAKQIEGWRLAIDRAHQVAREERDFKSQGERDRTLTAIDQKSQALADLDKIFRTDCPECRDLFCHLGNRDLEVRALAEQLREARQKLNMLEYVQAELTRFGIPEIGENGHKLSLVNRVKLLAERTSQRGRP